MKYKTRNTAQKTNTIITLINTYTSNSTARDATITIFLHSTAVKLIVIAIAGAIPFAPIQLCQVFDRIYDIA